jgi:TRAP-type C4-dicarboxylate transport system permease small subunit
LLNNLEKLILILLGILFAVMVTSLFYQIILRYFFHKANTWTEELTRYSFVWLVLLGSSVATRRGKQMNVDFVVNLMPKKLAKVNYVFTNLLINALFLVIMVYGFQLVSITHKQLSAGMQIPMSYIYLALPVGGSLMFLFTIESYFDKFKQNKERED